MNPSKRKSALVVLPILLTLLLGGPVNAEVILDWFDHDFGNVTVFAQHHEDGEETLLMHGLLKFAYPQGFQINYFTHEGLVSITGVDGFTELVTGNDVRYGQDRYWLFEDMKNYVFALAEFSKLPWRYSGKDEVAGCPARRYVAQEDEHLVMWIHEQTGLPFLIRSNNRTLVSIASFINDPETGQVNSVELQLLFAPEKATITLEYIDQSWVPAHLEVQEALGEVYVEFNDWSFSEEWEENPLPRLVELRELNARFLTEFEAQDWEAALQTCQEILSLAPQFWQVYLYQAFVYEGLDNYLGVVENYQQVLMRQPDNHLALNNLAYHYLLKEVQISQALEMAERAVALDRKAIYLDTLGYGYYLVGRLAEAKALLEEALTTAPEAAHEEITEHLNLVLEALGELKDDE